MMVTVVGGSHLARGQRLARTNPEGVRFVMSQKLQGYEIGSGPV